MGGADRQTKISQSIAYFFGGKKWYWCIFTWLIDISIQSAWVIHKKCGGNMQQFEFKQHIVQVYLLRYGSPPKRAGLSGLSYLQRKRKGN